MNKEIKEEIVSQKRAILQEMYCGSFIAILGEIFINRIHH